MAVPFPEQKVVIKPNQSWLTIDWAGLWQYRDLLVVMVQRDFTAKYRQTILGPAWFIINPLITTVVFTLLFGKVIGVQTDGVDPMLFYLSSLLGWTYFSNVLNATANSLAGNAGIFGKVYFPRLIPPLVMCASNLIAFFVQLAVFLVFWVYYLLATSFGATYHPNWSLALLPILIIQMAALGLGVGLILSAMTAKYRDLQQLTGFLVQIWMYGTPVIYPLSRVPENWRWLVQLNPMTTMVEMTRVVFLGVGSVTVAGYLVSIGVTAAILTIGVMLYQRMARTFVDTV
jgi:lipopolysaccharide transport system permease protein